MAAWTKFSEGWNLNEQGQFILTAAMECFDRIREAQAVLLKEGIVQKDRFGQSRQHPAVTIERHYRQIMLRHLKTLDLNLKHPEQLDEFLETDT